MDAFTLIKSTYLPSTSERYRSSKEEKRVLMIAQVVSTLIFAVAAYLSWNCNTHCDTSMSTIEKAARAMIAGYFGLLYIIIYMVSWSSTCRGCKKEA
jgi:hypothetical protein